MASRTHDEGLGRQERPGSLRFCSYADVIPVVRMFRMQRQIEGWLGEPYCIAPRTAERDTPRVTPVTQTSAVADSRPDKAPPKPRR